MASNQEHPIKRARLAMKPKKWSQEFLARQADLSVDTIRVIEAGQNVPRLDTARRIADALGKTVDELFPASAA
jgi:DNA-binding XRE family transcriptional regulator